MTITRKNSLFAGSDGGGRIWATIATLLQTCKMNSAEPDYTAQARRAFANLEAVLTAAGCSFADIIDVTSFHTDPEQQFGAFMEVKKAVFPQAPYPNWTAVGVNWLAGFDVEIKVIARVP